MRIAVLKTGSAPRAIQDAHGDFDQLFARILAQPGQQWQVYDAEHGELPALEEGHAAYLVTGSPASVTESPPWILDLLELIRQAHNAERTLLGICFGHQALARALGGAVQRNPLGMDIGTTTLTWTAAADEIPALAQAPRPLRILETHEDIVTRLPPGAVHLAQSARTAHEIFALGEHTLGLQGHPELTPEIVRYLVEQRQETRRLPEEQARDARQSLAHAPHTAFLTGWLRAFLATGRLQAPLPVPPLPTQPPPMPGAPS